MSSPSFPSRTVALCYIRTSMFSKDDTSLAPARQRAYIEAVCHQNGWTPEWFEDVGGHRSGRGDIHRPEWAKLWLRLSDPDIAAVVAYDLARLYRHGQRITTFMNVLRMNNIRLVLANPLKSFDTQDDKNHLLFNLMAMFDEMYAEDIRESILTSIEYRRSQGMHVGSIPFGTERNSEGYLVPSTQGAWILPDQTFISGSESDSMPVGSEWRGFYSALELIFQFFGLYEYSQDQIARELNQMGYRYRDRQGYLTPFERDDIRRILSNWPEYGGYRGGGNARRNERRALEKRPEDYQLNPEIAVLPIPLLRAVGERRRDISHETILGDRKRPSDSFVFSSFIRCVHCHKKALETGNPNSVTYLSGIYRSGVKAPIYRHRDQTCVISKKSVLQTTVNSQFLALVSSLLIDEQTLGSWQEEMNLQSHIPSVSTIDQEQQRVESAIKNHTFMLANGLTNFMQAKDQIKELEIEKKRLLHLRQQRDRLLKVPSSHVSDLVTTALALQDIVEKWPIVDDDEKHLLVRRVFEWMSYDLDTEEIVEFKLVKSAEVYLAALMRYKQADQ